MLSQLLVLFGFSALVLVSVFWINRAVRLFDRLIGDGQNALVFLEFTALGLPRLIVMVLPIAAFVAAVYVTNRLTNESELTVMQATGSGPWRLARPVLAFGLIVALMSSVLGHILAPTAHAQLVKREGEISRNITARLLTEGTFLTPIKGIAFYTRSIGADGVLRDVFLSDTRTPENRLTYTAAEAYLVRSDAGATLIMVDGLVQRLDTDSMRLSTAKFQDFSFDISGLVQQRDGGQTALRSLRTLGYLTNSIGVAAATGQSAGAIAEELHSRFAQPLFCIVAALIGFSTLLVGGYSRFGVWREATLAFVILLGLDGLRSSLSGEVIAQAQLWPLMYLPSGLGCAIAAGMLWFAAAPRWLRRRREVGGT